MEVRFYRKDGNTGQRIPVIFSLDTDNKTILDERIDHKLWARMKEDTLRAHTAPTAEVDVGSDIPKDIPKKYITKQTPNGVSKVEITKFDENFARWMIQNHDNPFTGTDGLREAFFMSMEDLDESNCSGCERSQTIQKFKHKVQRHVEGV